MATILNQIEFQMLSVCKENWYSTYPGFCNLLSDKEDKLSPQFLSGVGCVISSRCNEINKGDTILFCGYADTEAAVYRTTKNSIVKIQDNYSENIAAAGQCAQMIFAVSLLEPQGGMKIYIDPTIKRYELLAEVIEAVGCTAYKEVDSSIIYDGAILCRELHSELPLTSRAKVVCLTNIPGRVTCIAPGQDFRNPMYMFEGKTVPQHYMLMSTAKNLETAYQLIIKAKLHPNFLITGNQEIKSKCHIESSDIMYPDITITSFASLIKREFANHLNPGCFSIAVKGKDSERVIDLARGIAAFINSTQITKIKRIKAGPNTIEIIRFADGSVADCFGILSYKFGIDAEIHYDRTSFTYKQGELFCYKGKFKDKNTTTRASLTQVDYGALVELGKACVR